MRSWIILGALLGSLAPARQVQAAPSIEIRGAAARVVVTPEARPDVVVTVLQSNPRLKLRISRSGRKLTISGDIGHHVHGCPMLPSGRAVEIRGRGLIAVDELPRIAIRAPMDVHISAGEAVFGAVGRTNNLNLANSGCGDWLIGNVKGHLSVNETGSGNVRAGSAGSADLSIDGTGAVATREIAAGLTAISSGTGNIDVAAVTGNLSVRVAGSGDIRVPAGEVTSMTAAIAGSGSVILGGSARTLNASIVGPGDVKVSRVTGHVIKRLFGPGQVKVGPPTSPVSGQSGEAR